MIYIKKTRYLKTLIMILDIREGEIFHHKNGDAQPNPWKYFIQKVENVAKFPHKWVFSEQFPKVTMCTGIGAAHHVRPPLPHPHLHCVCVCGGEATNSNISFKN